MILLSKIPVLDKGFVAKLDSSGSGSLLTDVAVEYFKRPNGKFLTDVASLTVIMKCPLFVQLNLSTFGLKIVNLPTSGDTETYEPHIGEIGGTNHQVAQDMAQDMARTAASLVMNSRAYQQDGCDRFISQVLTPISTYTTILIHGMYNDWCKFMSQTGAPSSIAGYMSAIHQIMKAEWP